MEIDKSKVEILNDRGWEVVAGNDLKQDDIFRSYTSNGNLRVDNQGYSTWMALADCTSVGNGIVYIKAQGFKEREPHGN